MDDWVDLEPEQQHDVEPQSIPLPPDTPVQEGELESSSEHRRGSDAGGDKAQADRSADGSEQPVCRICFSGLEEADLGPLISPCLCRGTMSKVHVQCLNHWRGVSRGSQSFFQCDQCRYKYRIKRARIAGLAENRYALASLTFAFFLVLVTINGYIGNWLLRKGSSNSSMVSVLFFDNRPDDAYTPYGWHYRDSYLPLEAVGQAVQLASKVAEDIAVGNPIDITGRSNRRKRIAAEEEYDLEERSSSDALEASSYRFFSKRRKTRRKRAVGKVRAAVSHFTVGVSMTGIGSFLWLISSLPFWPLHPMRNGLLRTLRPSRDGRGKLSGLGAAVLILFVIVGLVKSLQLCWRLTRKTAQILLKRAELGILEVRA